MTKKHLLTGAGFALALIFTASATMAQQAPPADAKAPAAAPAGPQTKPAAYLYLHDRPDTTLDAQGKYRVPLAARDTDYAPDTPYMTLDECVHWYGEKACSLIVQTNSETCTRLGDSIRGMLDVDKSLVDSNVAYDILMDVYMSLPNKVRAVTVIRRTDEVVGTGALCILSLGLYCIAAVSNAVTNEAEGSLNDSMTMANIRLSVMNIVGSKATIYLQKIYIRLNAGWADTAYKLCQKNGVTFASVFGPLPAYDNQVPDFVRTGKVRDANQFRRDHPVDKDGSR